jgi:Tfp pilus assembly protein PilX
VQSLRIAKRRRRTTAMRSRSLPLRLSQSQLEDRESAISAPGHREATTAHAQCIPTLAKAPRNAARTSSLRNASVSDACSRPRMAPRPVAGLVRRGSTMMKWPRESENSGINHPRGTSRTSSLEIPTPGMIATAARSCTSCTAGAGNSPPAGTSSPCDVRSCRQLQGS